MITKITPIVSILVIGGLAAFALYMKVDGLLLAGSFAIIAGLGGYIAPHKKSKE